MENHEYILGCIVNVLAGVLTPMKRTKSLLRNKTSFDKKGIKFSADPHDVVNRQN